MNSFIDKSYVESITGWNVSRFQTIKQSKNENCVYRFKYKDEYYYLKAYVGSGSISDNETYIYRVAPPELEKYFKKLVLRRYSDEFDLVIGIYKEEKGNLLADYTNAGSLNGKLKKDIISSFMNFVDLLFQIETCGFGKICKYEIPPVGEHVSFIDFLWEYQYGTSKTLLLNKTCQRYADLPYRLVVKNFDLLNTSEKGLIPMDNNFTNIMITNQGIKYIDPGKVIIGPKEMAIGEFSFHCGKSDLFDEVCQYFDCNRKIVKKIHIYSILSGLNILAYLINNNVQDIINAKPFGNNDTFLDIIDYHLSFLLQSQDF